MGDLESLKSGLTVALKGGKATPWLLFSKPDMLMRSSQPPALRGQIEAAAQATG